MTKSVHNKLRIPETVAVEALSIVKWFMAGSIGVVLSVYLIPFLNSNVSEAKIGIVELKFVEEKLEEVSEERDGLAFRGAPSEVRQLLVDAKGLVTGKTALWIDNQPSNNTAIRHLLEEAGVSFDIVVNNDRATRALERHQLHHRYSLVISDSGRPSEEQNGVDFFLDYYRSKNRLPPWIFYSSTQRGNPVPGAYYSTTNPYEVINKSIEVLRSGDKSASVAKASPRADRSLPIMMFGIMLFACAIVIMWSIIRASALYGKESTNDQEYDKGTDPDRKNDNPA